MTRQTPAPIFVMSFNRPDYLARVLASLRAQIGADLAAREIALFQDGAVNPFSGERYAKDEDIAASVAVFRQYFPQGTVWESADNLGVALNFERAERYGFETLKAERIIFLEDDMELAPHYVQVLDALADQYQDDPRVGYVAAYGDHKLGLEEQQRRQSEIILLSHNWAFALYRRHWLRTRPQVLAYLDLLQGVDYRKRDSARIQALFTSWGFDIRETSQDVAKSLACCFEGVVKLNSLTCNARYIGQQGLHMRPETYSQLGYADTALFPDPVTRWQELDHSLYQRLRSQQLAWAQAQRPAISIPDEEFVHAVYAAILGRAPDPSGLQGNLSRLRHGVAPEKVIRSIFESQESRRRNAAVFAEAAKGGSKPSG